MLKLNSVWQTQDGTSRVLFTLSLPENGVQAEDDTEADTLTSPCIPDARWTDICQKIKILVPPWKLFLGFPHTTSSGAD